MLCRKTAWLSGAVLHFSNWYSAFPPPVPSFFHTHTIFVLNPYGLCCTAFAFFTARDTRNGIITTRTNTCGCGVNTQHPDPEHSLSNTHFYHIKLLCYSFVSYLVKSRLLTFDFLKFLTWKTHILYKPKQQPTRRTRVASLVATTV